VSEEAVTWAGWPIDTPSGVSGLNCATECVAQPTQKTWFLEVSTFVAALRRDRLGAPMVLDGPMTGQAFLAYVKQVLIPTLCPSSELMGRVAD
jgi:hypothetical protein